MMPIGPLMIEHRLIERMIPPHLFLPVMKYFSDQEKDDMLEEGRTFDSDLLHRDYADRVSALERNEEPEGA